MKTLIVTTDGLIEKAEVPMPAYGPKQALVKTVACGICNGTDAKLIHRKFKGVPLSEYPLMLGHEGVGKVVETGAECVSLKKGDYAASLRGYGSCRVRKPEILLGRLQRICCRE